MAEHADTENPNWHTVLRSQGYRLTPQRALVLDAVERLGHGTPDEIHAAVTARSAEVNLSTIYRNLALLDELGLIRHVYLSDRTPVYHSRTTPAHVHLLCDECQAVTDADPRDIDALAESLERTYRFQLNIDRLVIAGRCRKLPTELTDQSDGVLIGPTRFGGMRPS